MAEPTTEEILTAARNIYAERGVRIGPEDDMPKGKVCVITAFDEACEQLGVDPIGELALNAESKLKTAFGVKDNYDLLVRGFDLERQQILSAYREAALS